MSFTQLTLQSQNTILQNLLVREMVKTQVASFPAASLKVYVMIVDVSTVN